MQQYMTPAEVARQVERLRESTVIGLDLGQSQDYTALSVLRVMPQLEGKPVLQCGHLERFKLGTKYPAIVDSVVQLTQRRELGENWSLVLDATGVGKAVVDMFTDALGSQKSRLAAVTITAGNSVTGGRMSYGVPKKDLVTTLLVLLESGRLVFADLPEMPQLSAEMLDFRVKITESGNAIWGSWREGSHDDLVLSVAMAAWYAEKRSKRPTVVWAGW
jgi:hypothetical protein